MHPWPKTGTFYEIYEDSTRIGNSSQPNKTYEGILYIYHIKPCLSKHNTTILKTLDGDKIRQICNLQLVHESSDGTGSVEKGVAKKEAEVAANLFELKFAFIILWLIEIPRQGSSIVSTFPSSPTPQPLNRFLRNDLQKIFLREDTDKINYIYPNQDRMCDRIDIRK